MSEGSGREASAGTAREHRVRQEPDTRSAWLVRHEEHRRKVRRRTRFAWLVVSVALALTVAGCLLKPVVQDALIVSRACDGALAQGALEELLAGSRPGGQSSTTERRAGSYRCGVIDDEDRLVFSVHTYTERDAIDRRMAAYTDDRSAEALPAGLPGYVIRDSGHALLLRCPGRGKDAAGRTGRLLVRVHSSAALPAQVRAGAAVAGKAAEKLGCGAKPPAVPARSAAGAGPVPLAKTRGTACAALADLAHLFPGARAEVRAGARHSPLTSCTVLGPGTDGEYDHRLLQLRGWYGDWAPLRQATAAKGTWETRAHKDGRPWLVEREGPGTGIGWATSRCGSEDAGFELRADAEAKPSEKRRAPSREEMRRVLKAFAEDQSERHGCRAPRTPER
ncbi:hypothetical protein [Streptomyces cacaoi]|uniref:hypothetical protein n=1 Tax=Streptomyces cacaoi TaxID=1898 RepID=UPI003330508F